MREAWDGHPESVGGLIRSVEDPSERYGLVVGLMRDRGGRGDALCPLLEEPTSREACARTADRGHLWTPPVDTVEPSQGAPLAALPLPSLEAPNRLADLPVVAVDCDRRPSPDRCRSIAAEQSAEEGDATRAAGICLGLDAGATRDECHFKAAEAMARKRGIDSYPDAVDLCLVAGDFEGNCLGHVLRALVAEAPAASDPSPTAWAPLLAGADQIGAAWSQRDPDYGRHSREVFWSELTMQAMARASVATGDLQEVLPDEALPHLRAAIAWRIVDGLGSEPVDLPTLEARFDQAMKARDKGISPRQRAGPVGGARDLWGAHPSMGEEGPTVVYRATSRRLISPDPQVDRSICLLEALARARPGEPASLEAARNLPDPLAQRTAERLLATPMPEPMRAGAPANPPR